MCRFIWVLGAALLVLSVSSSAWGADVPISEEARAHFKRGVDLLTTPGGAKYGEAYVAFKAAYAASPSPRILGNIGLCAMKLERDGEAIEAYERYLNESGAVSDKEGAEIVADLLKLKGSLVRLKLTFEPREVTVIDERIRVVDPPVVNEYEVKYGRLEIGARQGLRRMTVRRAGYEPVTWQMEPPKGLVWKRAVKLVPRQAPPPGPSGRGDAAASHPDPDEPDDETDDWTLPTGVWISIGATGVLAATAAVVGGVSLAQKANFEDKLDAGDLEAAEDLRDSGKELNLATDILLISAGAAALLTVIIYFVAPDEPEQTAWSLGPSLGPDSAGLTLGGAF